MTKFQKWQTGESGNPQGKPAGARNRLQTKFLYALAADFEEWGEGAIKAARLDSPIKYIQVVAGLMPKEFSVTHNQLEELSDEELARLRELLNGPGVPLSELGHTKPEEGSVH